MSDVIWVNCGKCGSKAEKSFSGWYCSNTKCDQFDSATLDKLVPAPSWPQKQAPSFDDWMIEDTRKMPMPGYIPPSRLINPQPRNDELVEFELFEMSDVDDLIKKAEG